MWGAIDDVDSSLYTTYGIGQSLNTMEFVDEEMNDLLLQTRVEMDYDKRKAILEEWQKLFVEKLPCVTTYVPVQTYAAKTTSFTGYDVTYGNYGYVETRFICGVHQV